MVKKLSLLVVALLACLQVILMAGCGTNKSDSNQSSATESKSSESSKSSSSKSESSSSSKSSSEEKSSSSSQSKSSENGSKSSSSAQSSDSKITAKRSSNWKEEEHVAAEKFANELVTLVKSKDLNSISKKVSYPITLKIDGKETKVENEKQFVDLGFDKIFTEKVVKGVTSTTELLSRDTGFVFGDGEVWISPTESGDVKIIAINS